MNITQEKTGNLTAEINIHLTPEDYKTQVTEELKRQARKASMPGFRPGKVPLGLVRKMVGKAVVVEEINKTVSKGLADYLQEEKLNILGDPIPTEQKTEDDFDEHCEKDIDFTFEIGLAPEIAVNYSIKNTPPQYEIVIDDAFMDEEIEQYRDRRADVSNPEEVEKDDILYGKLFELDDKGEKVEEGYEHMIALNPKRIEKASVFEPFIGAKVESVHDIDIFSIAEEKKEIASLLFIEEDKLDELKDKTLKFEIKKINRLTKPELDAEFFQKVAESQRWESTEGMETLEEFKDKLAKKMEEELSESAKWYYRNKLQEELLAANPLELPDEFLKKWMLKSQEDYTEERVAEEYPNFTQSVIWSLLVEQVMKDEEIEITREDLEESVRKIIRENMGAVEGGMDDEKENEFVNHAMQNKEMVEMQFRRVRDERLYAALEEKVPGEQESITATDFVEMTKKEKEEKA